MSTIYDYEVKDRKGAVTPLRSYAHEVLLIVNTATQCGFTPQYEELQALSDKFKGRGFVVLDFPCNQFGQQTPGTDAQIHEFCQMNYNTDFPRFKKVKVNGDDAEPLFKFLQSEKPFAGFDKEHPLTPILEKVLGEADPDYAAKNDIKWNFTKFLINKNGEVVERYEPTAPIEKISSRIEELLA